MKSFTIILLTLFSISSFSMFDFDCSDEEGRIHVELKKTILNDLIGELHYNEKSYDISLQRHTVSRGIAHFRDHSRRNEFKVDFSHSLEYNGAVIQLSTHFNSILEEAVELNCE